MTEAEFETQLESAKTEAMKAFGDQIMLIEKYVVKPRHVEVQVFGDRHGNHVYLFERDCSVQRRHQKIIEEAPAPGLSDDVRHSIGEAAVRAAKAVNYVGAGTVEFIMDENQQFYFMEMNTRLQVEHPVTEMITNTDLVEWQLRVATGEPLPLTQQEVKFHGHAFEARIYAEDPNNAFMPGAGPLLHLSTPTPDSTVRIETGVRQGDEVSIHYDPLIAKLVVWAEDRQSALRRTVAALKYYHVVGLHTNLQFLVDLANHPAFQASQVHTDFIPQHSAQLFPDRVLSPTAVCQAVAALIALQRSRAATLTRKTKDPFSPFASCGPTRVNETPVQWIALMDGEKKVVVEVRTLPDGRLGVRVDGGEERTMESQSSVEGDVTSVRCSIDGVISSASVILQKNCLHVFSMEGSRSLHLPIPDYLQSRGSSDTLNDPVAPMPGMVERVLVTEGATVQQGEPLVVMIAMKMEYIIRAPRPGVVAKIMFKEGDTVSKGVALVHFAETENAEKETEG